MIDNFPYYKTFCELLNTHEVEYLCVGGFAVNLWGFNRGTNDLDLWINPKNENKIKLENAIEEFGFEISPIHDVELDERSHPIRLGDGKNMIEILHTLCTPELSFENAYSKMTYRGSTSFKLPVTYLDDLITVKSRLVRNKDKEDLTWLMMLKEKNK